MITNDFFKGYFQALNVIEDITKNLKETYSETNDIINSEEALDSVLTAIQGVRTSYQEIVIKLNREMNETK